MNDKRIRHVGMAGLLALLTLFAMPSAKASAQAASPSNLGDLSQFRTIVADVSTMIDKADFAGAKTRIKDLETLCDRNETKLKPKAPTDWHSLDRAIDAALHEVRQGKPNQKACQDSLKTLIKLIDKLAGKP